MTEKAVTSVVYPRFIGVDESGEMVWELANGRWTWADDPYMAVRRTRTFAPDCYLDKYGPVKVPAEFTGRVVETTSDLIERVRSAVWVAPFDYLMENRGRADTVEAHAADLARGVALVRAIVGQPDELAPAKTGWPYDREGPAPVPTDPGISRAALDASVAEAFEDGKRRGAETAPPGDKVLVSKVLYALLVNLDGWIEGAHSNHEGSDHRGEGRGEECWRQFAPADIRNMINDVAREFGVSEFPRPDKGLEETYR